MENRSSDVVVIGGGILGCATACELAKRGMKVILLEAGTIGQGTSSKNFSWINSTSKTNNRDYFNLNAASLELYRSLAKQWRADEVGVHKSGMLEWANAGDDLRLKTIHATAKTLAGWGYSIQSVDDKTLKGLEPNVHFEAGSEGYLADDDCWLDVPIFLQFLVRQIQASHGEIMEHCRAQELLADDNGKILGVLTEKGQINCAKVLVATGSETADVLSQLTGYEGFASRFPLQQAPGLLVYTPPIKPLGIKHVMYPPDRGGLHIRPTSDGGLLLGADDTDGLICESQTKQVQKQAAKSLLQRVQQHIPDFEGVDLLEQCRTAIGIRAVPTDDLSIAGPMLSAEGLYIVLTHSGITLAPLLGKLVAECVETDEMPSLLQPYSIDRFGLAG